MSNTSRRGTALTATLATRGRQQGSVVVLRSEQMVTLRRPHEIDAAGFPSSSNFDDFTLAVF
jgi:hypothetical protein